MRAVVLVLSLVALHASAQQPGNVTPIDAGPIALLTPGTWPVHITVHNLDTDYAIDSLQAHWQLDGGAVHSCAVHTFTVYTDLLYPTFKDRFTHADPLVVPAAGSHQLKVWTSMPGGFPDVDPTNDTLITTVHVVDSLPPQHTMMFYGTHVQCFPCGTYGEPAVEAVLDSFPDALHMASVFDQVQDLYEIPDGELFNQLYIWPYTGHPAFVFDVMHLPFLTDVTTHVWNELYRNPQWRLAYRSPVEVTVAALAFDTATRVLSGEVHAGFWADHSGALTMNAIITEDSVHGPQAGAPGDSVHHRFILRGMTAGVSGEPGLIPPNVSAGQQFVYAFSDTLAPEVEAANVHVVGTVQQDHADPLQRVILNSGSARLVLDDATQVAEVPRAMLSVHPNPAKDKVLVRASAASRFALYDAHVRPVMTGTLNEGDNTIAVGALSEGPYLLRVADVGGAVRHARVVILR